MLSLKTAWGLPMKKHPCKSVYIFCMGIINEYMHLLYIWISGLKNLYAMLF